MPSLLPGFEYDIFISYRQKDNKGDRWVSEFEDDYKFKNLIRGAESKYKSEHERVRKWLEEEDKHKTL